MFNYLTIQPAFMDTYKSSIKKEALILFEEAKKSMDNDRDIEVIQRLMQNYQN